MLEDREEYIARQAASGAYSPEQLAALERRPFAPLALVNPVLRPVGQLGAAFFEGCLSVKGYAVGDPHPTPAAPLPEATLSCKAVQAPVLLFRACSWHARGGCCMTA